jgi:DNA-binding LytR/AlgR family response regulator
VTLRGRSNFPGDGLPGYGETGSARDVLDWIAWAAVCVHLDQVVPEDIAQLRWLAMLASIATEPAVARGFIVAMLRYTSQAREIGAAIRRAARVA